MCYLKIPILITLLFITPVSLPAEPVIIPDMITITASNREAPPSWAVMERHLIDTMEEAADFYVKRFTRRGGTIYGYGPWDDVLEMFYNWPLFYAIGADEKLLTRALDEYNALTRQLTFEDPQLYREYPALDGWFHTGEGIMSFYDFAVADPTIPENIDRACRFAGFYLNEDTLIEKPIYDPKRKLIRSIVTGSKGYSDTIMDHPDGRYLMSHGWGTYYPLYPIVKDRELGWGNDQKRFEEFLKLYDEIVTPCDTPMNLAITGLMTNAYLYTGEEKYKNWVLEYVDAWMERIRANNGIIPDNIGRTGKIGEYRNGQWWGGMYGWTGTYAIHFLIGSVTVASECAYILTGDPDYLNMLRSQIDVLLDNSITTKEGQLLVPYNYGPDGWTNYAPMRMWGLSHLWHASMAPEDWQRIERLKKGNKFLPHPYHRGRGQWKPEKSFDWNEAVSTRDRDDNYTTEFPRISYYAGENPDWPLNILKAEYREVVKTLEFIRNDPRDIQKIHSDDLHRSNPVVTKGLVQVTMGAPQTIYNGGLLRARVRYFDRDRVRPGLPEDVAALVEGLEADRTVVQLVNLSVMHTRRLIIQAGAFGEHEFTEVKFTEKSKDVNGKVMMSEKSVPVNKKYFEVELPPATSIRLDIGTRRFVNKPSYAFPWHGDNVSVK